MKSLLIAALAMLALAGTALAQDIVPPPAVTIGGAVGHSTIVITFTSVGDQCNNNTCAAYDLRMSSSPITECNFLSATQLSTTSPESPGNPECFDVTSLDCNTTYYFALKVQDSAGLWSLISNSLARTTRACNNYTEVACEP